MTQKKHILYSTDKRTIRSVWLHGFWLVAFVVLAGWGASAQTPMPVSTDPYFCSFEDAAEKAYWVFESGSNTSQWVIGPALSNYGTNSLYVSPDGGATAGYDVKGGYVAAYRDFQLVSRQVYEVSFEWINPTQGKLYVCWFDPQGAANQPPYSGTSTLALPTYVKLNARPWTVGGQVLADTLMNNSGAWQKGSFTVTGTGRTARLLFFWMNDTGAACSTMHGPAIDNVQVGRVTSCGYIGEVSYEPTDNKMALLSWKVLMDAVDGSGKVTDVTSSTMATYDVRYFDGMNWHEITDIPNPYFEIPELAAGFSYTVWVRMHCGYDGSTGNWYILNDLFIPEVILDCLDYLDLTSESVTATYGTCDNPYLNEGVVNDGPGAQSSRLTIHSDKDERDARTGNQLRTVPVGSQASVRLGNWGVDAQAESVTFDYVIDESTILLLLNYAVVIQDPNHEESNQPRFTMEILDEKGRLIDATCGAEDFIAGTDNTTDDSWHRTGMVQWKDWTSFGLNLKEIGLQGNDRIRIRLTTYDCSQGGHYGYAYFTLSCAKAQISGVSCGEVVHPLLAPDGFTYKWYRKENPDSIVSDERTFLPEPDDVGVYVCELGFKNGECSFALEAVVAPRIIISDFTPRISYNACKAVVNFENTSYTTTEDGDIGECEGFEWSWGDGEISTDEDLMLEFDGPGEHEVTLTSMIAAGECFESVTKKVVIPPFAPYVDTLQVSMCAGDPPYESDYNHVLYSRPGLYQVLDDTTRCGCDSLVYLDLAVHDTFAIQTEAELFLYKEPYYDFNGRQLTETGVYYDSLQTVTGCDSVITLRLTAYDRLEVALAEDSVLLCGNEVLRVPLEYAILSGSFTDYRLLFDERARAAGWQNDSASITPGQTMIEVPVPDPVRPDVYEADLICGGDEYSGPDTVDVRIVVYYPSAVMAQKWNDVLALYNENHNGGYAFSAYQWYKDGVALDGETGSYLYQPLDTAAHYQVLLTRADDGVAMLTCPFVPEVRGVVDAYPTVVGANEYVTVTTPGEADVEWWNVMGLRLSSKHMAGKHGALQAPAQTGTYLLVVKPLDGERRIFTVVVR